jgi:hypothetical protein
MSGYQLRHLLERYAQILREYCEQNPSNSQSILALLGLARHSAGLRQWVVEVGVSKSIELRKKIIETYLSSIKLGVDDEIPGAGSTAGLSYYLVYPILLHS